MNRKVSAANAEFNRTVSALTAHCATATNQIGRRRASKARSRPLSGAQQVRRHDDRARNETESRRNAARAVNNRRLSFAFIRVGSETRPTFLVRRGKNRRKKNSNTAKMTFATFNGASRETLLLLLPRDRIQLAERAVLTTIFPGVIIRFYVPRVAALGEESDQEARTSGAPLLKRKFKLSAPRRYWRVFLTFLVLRAPMKRTE